ncbi:hypothetical protein BX600DRAFT_518680 [Xylariales sp. PMI_506]|nr:hypothetical protein BX600DRAFT_518680 [Xylariales sp. PMI_506]
MPGEPRNGSPICSEERRRRRRVGEDVSAYQFYIDTVWLDTNPGVNASGLNIPNVSAGGQSTFYYSEVCDLFVWIGQLSEDVTPDFYITTCASPEGPWVAPTHFFTAPAGNAFGGYSLQAHLSLLSSSTENAIYLSYTRSETTTV